MIATITANSAGLFRILFWIFAIMMLPFATPLFSRKLRAKMGLKWVTITLISLLIIVPAFLALIAPSLFENPWERIQHHDSKFYARLAEACDQLLAKHPPVKDQIISVPITDPTLPQAIKDVHPIKLQVAQYGVGMVLVSDSRAGFGLFWEPKEENTNTWVLSVSGEGGHAELFSSNRNFPSTRALNSHIPLP